MERDHEFNISLPGEGAFDVKLLEGVRIEQADGGIVGRWAAFDLEARGANEDEVTRSC
jgi:hypothetical protein